MDIEEDFIGTPKNNVAKNDKCRIQNSLNTYNYNYESRYINQSATNQGGIHIQNQDTTNNFYQRSNNQQNAQYHNSSRNTQECNVQNINQYGNQIYLDQNQPPQNDLKQVDNKTNLRNKKLNLIDNINYLDKKADYQDNFINQQCNIINKKNNKNTDQDESKVIQFEHKITSQKPIVDQTCQKQDQSDNSSIQKDKNINSQSNLYQSNQVNTISDISFSKDDSKIQKRKKKKRLVSSYQNINPCPSFFEYQAYLLKGQIPLELNRNEDSKDYLPIGFKMNPYNTWKPIQRVIAHHKYNCIEIQVANCGKPTEDFSFIINILSSYGDSKYRDIALSLEKYQKIIQEQKLLNDQLQLLSSSGQEQTSQKNPINKLNTSSNDKVKQGINQEEYEKAFFKQFYERAMDVLGSMNKAGENIFFAFTMGKYDKYGFFEEMFNFGVNKNFLMLLGSEMDQVSNAFLRNGWLEIFDYETRINNALNFVNLITNGYEKQIMEQKKMIQQQQLEQQQQQSQNNNDINVDQEKQNLSRRSSFSSFHQQKQQSAFQEVISEPIEIVVNTFDQIKVPAKMKMHDIMINQFALKINMIDISPNMIQQVHAIRQKYINQNKSVNYIQMFDQNFIYTTESQNFLKSFYPNHSLIQQKNKISPFDLLETSQARQEIDQLRCGFKFLK